MMNKKAFVSLLIALFALSMNGIATFAQSSTALFSSKQFVARTTAEDHFQDTLSLQPGQENLPLSLVVCNGGAGKVPFNWFRLSIGGYLLASERDLAGRPEAAIDVTGRIQPGGGQILIDAAGEPGATMSFSLVSSPVSISKVEPSAAEPGQHILIHGSGFSSNEYQNSVFVGSTETQIFSASPGSITAVIPANMQSGQTQVRVVVNGLQTQSVPLTISSYPAPQLLSTNYWMAPPGAELIITGKNFAPQIADNKVFFKNVQGQIVSATSDSIVVIVPQWSFGPQQLNIPLFVESRGIRSSNAIRFDFGPKYEGQLPPFPGDSSSEATP